MDRTKGEGLSFSLWFCPCRQRHWNTECPGYSGRAGSSVGIAQEDVDP